ncbi:hypothetical protein MUK42_16068 [Musa troglodytarum]|uniref:Uncharacterized protein n=1 Tax=Musa troglodytarum TaxID=320322 RepID=A0A9E7HHQ6_9LILI|nr:hypothetical protein MUK42_16068 [Musa troglodytarum]
MVAARAHVTPLLSNHKSSTGRRESERERERERSARARGELTGDGNRKGTLSARSHPNSTRSRGNKKKKKGGGREGREEKRGRLTGDTSPPPMLQRQPSLPPPLTTPVTKHSRIDLGELKSQLAKQLDQEQAIRYFGYLNGLLSQKLSKHEFNKFCIMTLGHENLPLHNQLIRSRLRNACQAKAQPSVNHGRFAHRPTGIVSKNSPESDDGLDFSQALTWSHTWSNEDILPWSNDKFRGGSDNNRIRDCRSPLGQNRRVEVAPRQPSLEYDEAVLGENDDLSSCYLKRSVQQQQGGAHELPAKRARIEEPSLLDQGSVHYKVFAEVVPPKCGENMDHRGDLDSFRGPLQAPLGILFCSASTTGARRRFLSAGTAVTDSFCRNYDCSELCETEILKKRMEKIAQSQGLEGVTMDCANLLSSGLLSLKRHLHHNITPEVSSCYVIDIMEDSGGSFAGPFSLARPLRLVGFAHCSRVLMLVLHLSQQAPNSAGKEQPEVGQLRLDKMKQ